MKTYQRLMCSLGLGLALVACEPEPEQLAVSAVLDQTVAALESGDMEALWELSAPKAREDLLAFHAKIHDALDAAARIYPPEELERARSALGEAVFGAIPRDATDAGPRLLDALLDEKAMRLDEEARDGLRTRGAVIDGPTAIIHTSAGEQFTFERTGEGWRSRLVMDLVEQNRRLAMLEENARTVMAAADTHRKAWVASKDPRTPQGAYNLLREAAAATPPDAALLFTLIDEEARGVVLEALEASREIQKVIQKKTAKKAREAAYAEHGLAAHVKAASDRELFASWVGSPAFTRPVTGTEEPDRLNGDETTGEVEVVTSAGQATRFKRDANGLWHLAGQAEALRAALLAPVEQARSKLTEAP